MMEEYKCSETARQKCPDSSICGGGIYMGTDCECAKFNEKCLQPKERKIVSELRLRITALQAENAELNSALEDEREHHNVYAQLMSDKCATLTKALLGIAKLVSDYGYCTHFAGFTCDKDFPEECPKCITNYFKRLARSAINSKEGEK